MPKRRRAKGVRFWRDAGIAVNSAAGSSTLTVECNQSRLGRERRGAGFLSWLALYRVPQAGCPGKCDRLHLRENKVAILTGCSISWGAVELQANLFDYSSFKRHACLLLASRGLTFIKT